MGWSTKPRIASLTLATGAAFLTALPRPHETGGSIAVYSEIVCWILVLAFTECVRRSRHLGWVYNDVLPAQQQAYLPWLAATCIAVTTLSSYVGDTGWVLPAIVPFLVVLRNTAYLPRLPHSTREYLQSQWICIGIGAASTVALVHSYSLSSLGVGATGLMGLVGFYGLLIRTYEQDAMQLGQPPSNGLLSLLRALAIRTAGITALLGVVLLLAWPPDAVPLIWVFVYGGMKALHWTVMFWVTQTLPWELAPIILTFAAASGSIVKPAAFVSINAIQLSTGFFVALTALLQAILFLPKNVVGRYLLSVLAFWPLGLFIFQLSSSKGLSSLPGGIWYQRPAPGSTHPIEELVTQAQKKFDDLVQRQSQTIQSAEQEYRRRYSREPPPGFDKWFTYAQSKQSIVIDDYDMITEDLKPFWYISPLRLLESIDHVTSFEHLALRKCGFTNGEYHGQGGGWIVDDLGHKLLDEVRHDIPNVEFAFDVVDEPRVVITKQMLEAGGVAKPEFYDAEHKSIWGRVTTQCQDQKASEYKPNVYDYNIPFVQDWYQAKDVCQHPEFAHMHGFFASPETCMLTDAPIPILSQAAPTTFGDIMYPSPWYPAKVDQGVYKPEADPVWEDKLNTLYWAGSTTGSHSWNGSWRYSQRQRFVQLVQTINETSHRYLKQDTPDLWKDYTAIEDHSALYDVKLTAIIQCDEDDCAEQKEYFNVHNKEDREQQFRSRFVFDLDGNSFSGRFYTLLQSKSVVLKQTVLREWHDERLIPWMHYVPVSMGMQELPEIMRYLTSEQGEKLAKQIADKSREGHEKMLRREDMTVYLYRLMLELARIMDPNRKVERPI